MRIPTTWSMTWDFVVIIWPYYLGIAVIALSWLKMEPPKWLEKRGVLGTVIAIFSPFAVIPAAHELSDEVGWHLGKRYFDRLCERYAGEAVLRQASNIAGYLYETPEAVGIHAFGLSRWNAASAYAKYGYMGNGISSMLSTGSFAGTADYAFVEGYVLKKLDERPQLVRRSYVISDENWPTYRIPGETTAVTRFSTQAVPTSSATYGLRWESKSFLLLNLFWIVPGRMTIEQIETKAVLAQHQGFLFGRLESGRSTDTEPWNGGSMCNPSQKWSYRSLVKQTLLPVQRTPGEQK